MQVGVKYHFKSFWNDATSDWTPVSQTIGEHSTFLANEPVLYIYIYICVCVCVCVCVCLCVCACALLLLHLKEHCTYKDSNRYMD